MTPDEFDQYLDDLETRLERLRSLYEQYFMGMERIEPSVARKDVDRRFWMLRREKVRNTARRFKLQTLVQRYNTLQQYWHRTCREIEQGTYRRHKLKAERSMAAASAAPSATAPPPAPQGDESVQRSRQATRSAEEDLKALLASDFDPAAEVDAALDAIFGGPATAQPSPQTAVPKPSVLAGPPPARGTAPPGPPPRRAPGSSPGSGAPAGPTGPAGAAGRPLPAASALPPPRSSLAPPTAPRVATAQPAHPAPPAQPALPTRPAPPAPATSPAARSATASPAAPRSAAPRSAAPSPAAPRPTPSPPAPPRPSPPQAAAAPAARPGTRSTPGDESLSEARIRELHQRYLAARSGGPSQPMSLDKLAQSLRATEQKLRQQHRGRRIDFDIVVRDGKPVIKPKLS